MLRTRRRSESIDWVTRSSIESSFSLCFSGELNVMLHMYLRLYAYLLFDQYHSLVSLFGLPTLAIAEQRTDGMIIWEQYCGCYHVSFEQKLEHPQLEYQRF